MEKPEQIKLRSPSTDYEKTYVNGYNQACKEGNAYHTWDIKNNYVRRINELKDKVLDIYAKELKGE